MNLDRLDTFSNEELASIHERINKEVKRRSGADVDVKKLRDLAYRLAKSLGCDWVPESLPGGSLQEHTLPKRRGRKPKTVESAQTVAAIETKVEEPALRVGVDEEKRKAPWAL